MTPGKLKHTNAVSNKHRLITAAASAEGVAQKDKTAVTRSPTPHASVKLINDFFDTLQVIADRLSTLEHLIVRLALLPLAALGAYALVSGHPH